MYRWNLAPTHKGCVIPLGLNEVPCVESYKGLIFGNWDTSAPGRAITWVTLPGIWMAMPDCR